MLSFISLAKEPELCIFSVYSIDLLVFVDMIGLYETESIRLTMNPYKTIYPYIFGLKGEGFYETYASFFNKQKLIKHLS